MSVETSTHNKSHFGNAATLAVDGLVETQPLHLPKINVNSQQQHNNDDTFITGRIASAASSKSPATMLRQQRRSDENHHSSSHKQEPHNLKKNHEMNRSFTSSSLSYRIPNGVRAVYTPDVNKVSMPIFGGRPGCDSAMLSGRNTAGALPAAAAAAAAQPVDVDEYFSILKEKFRANSHEMRAKFRHADSENKGSVSKEAFAHLIAAILGPSKPLSHQHFLKLIDKMGLRQRSSIKFEDCLAAFFLQQERRAGDTEWVDAVRASESLPLATAPVRKATQMFVILKERANLRTSDIVDLVPELSGGSPSRIFKLELLNLIDDMNVRMDSDEFEKLWKKFDIQNLGFVSSGDLLKKLGVWSDGDKSGGGDATALSHSYDDLFNNNSADEDNPPQQQQQQQQQNGRRSRKHNSNNNNEQRIPTADVPDDKPTNNYSVRSAALKAKKNPIEKWLKKRFRDGFSKMKASFDEIDLQHTGQVRRDQFLNVLRQHGLSFESNLLDSFLERCGVRVAKNSSLISYTAFLAKFQNRGENGLAYRAITDDESEDGKTSVIGDVERRLIRMFQNDFLGLLQIFRKIDRNKTNTISKQEFRAAIESNFSIELTHSEFEEFLKEVPMDGPNRVKYLEFMTRFDTDASSTLFDARSIDDDHFEPRKIKKYETIEEEDTGDDSGHSPRRPAYGAAAGAAAAAATGTPGLRSLKELREILKDKVRNQYKDVEHAWREVDLLNANEMNKDMLWHFFKKMKMTPAISREEVELLWREFLLKDNNKLEYWQFVRHFGYSKRSAAYVNSKRAPPTKGDCDKLLTSNKLGRDSILIRGSVQSKLILQFSILKRTFQDMDPYYTGYLLREEFEEVLGELCPELNKPEMDAICAKYENPADGRINFIEFLEPYGPRRGGGMAAGGGGGGGGGSGSDSYRERLSEAGSESSRDIHDTLTMKLRNKLSQNYRDLRKSFKRHDYKQTGFVSVAAFKEILDSTKLRLNDEEMFTLLRRLDDQLVGSINYSRFINDMIKP